MAQGILIGCSARPVSARRLQQLPPEAPQRRRSARLAAREPVAPLDLSIPAGSAPGVAKTRCPRRVHIRGDGRSPLPRISACGVEGHAVDVEIDAKAGNATEIRRDRRRRKTAPARYPHGPWSEDCCSSRSCRSGWRRREKPGLATSAYKRGSSDRSTQGRPGSNSARRTFRGRC